MCMFNIRSLRKFSSDNSISSTLFHLLTTSPLLHLEPTVSLQASGLDTQIPESTLHLPTPRALPSAQAKPAGCDLLPGGETVH